MTGIASKGKQGLVKVAGHMVALMAMDVPFPCDQIISRSAAHWPQAADVCTGQRGHAVISLMGAPSNLLLGVRILTSVAGALARDNTDEVLGGLWDGTVLNSREAWQEQSAKAFSAYPELPISLWVSLHLFNAQPGGRIITQGLTRFVGRELELIEPQGNLRRLVQRLQGFSVYLAQNGPVLRDGETFGISETERITLRLGESERFRGLSVISANLPSGP